MKNSIAALGVGLALAAGASVAAADPARPEPRVEREIVVIGGPDGPGGMDGDKDGVVTRAEFDAMHARMWARLDANGDGRLDRGEFGHGPGGDHVVFMDHGGPGERMPHPAGHGDGSREVRIVRRGGEGGLDADKDGKLSFEEFAGPLREHFREADRNRNGFLDKEETDGEGDRVTIRRFDTRKD